jgi:hypothetical protein
MIMIRGMSESRAAGESGAAAAPWRAGPRPAAGPRSEVTVTVTVAAAAGETRPGPRPRLQWPGHRITVTVTGIMPGHVAAAAAAGGP